MITTQPCPICGENVVAEKAEMNGFVLEHLKKNHPIAAENVTSTIMEIGKMRDKIARMKKDLKRATGYKIPEVQP